MKTTTISMATVLVLCGPLSAQGQDGSLRERIAQMRPAEELWQKIRWRTDLAAARDEAAKRGLPVFIWAMNGNPLGCT